MVSVGWVAQVRSEMDRGKYEVNECCLDSVGVTKTGIGRVEAGQR